MLRAASGKPVISYLGVLARRSIPAVFIRGWVRLHRLPMNAATSQTNSSLRPGGGTIHWSRNGNQRPARKSNGVSIDWINLERWEKGDLNLIARHSYKQLTELFFLFPRSLCHELQETIVSRLTDWLTYGKYLQQVVAPQQILPALLMPMWRAAFWCHLQRSQNFQNFKLLEFSNFESLLAS